MYDLSDQIVAAVMRNDKSESDVVDAVDGAMSWAEERWQRSVADGDGEYQLPETAERFMAYFLDELALNVEEMQRCLQRGDPEDVFEGLGYLPGILNHALICTAMFKDGYRPEHPFQAFRALPDIHPLRPDMVVANVIRQVGNADGPRVWFLHTWNPTEGRAAIYGRIEEGYEQSKWREVAWQLAKPGPVHLNSYWNWAKDHEGQHDQWFIDEAEILAIGLPDDIYKALPNQRELLRNTLRRQGYSEYEIRVALDPKRRYFFDEGYMSDMDEPDRYA